MPPVALFSLAAARAFGHCLTMANNVYCYFDSSEHAESNQPHMLRLWVRSWTARGWTPRILTVRNAEKHPRYDQLKHDYRNLCMMAAEATNVKWVCPIEAINFSFTPRMFRKQGAPLARQFGSVGWESSPVVHFPNIHDMSLIEHCGRPL